MNVYRKKLLGQYLEKVLLVQAAEREQGRTELAPLAVDYLNTAEPQQRLSQQIVEIFSMNISAKTSFDFAAARNIFLVMEKYVINLLDCPWKREFRKITMYSGFYKTQIEPSLKEAWKLLQMVGYEKVGMCLELKLLPDASRLQDMAFEFFLASSECLIYKNVFQVSLSGYTLRDIHKCRSNISGNSDVLFEELSKFCMRGNKQGESCESKVSSQVQVHLLKVSKNQQSEKYSEYEAKVGSGVQIGGMQSESSQRHLGDITKAEQLPEPEKEGNDCGTRTESVEAMLREITPEMLSDINIRRQILTKLNEESLGKKFHGSMPLRQMPCERAAASDTRAHTEPLFIPKQPKTVLPSASSTHLFTEPLLNLKQKKIESKVVPNVQAYTVPLPVPKETFAVDSDHRPWTEPLLIPKQGKVPSKLSRKSDEVILPNWQCGHCFYSNNAAVNVEKCGTCGKPRKEV